MSTMTSVTPPPCPDCLTVTEWIEIEEIWRCAPDCTRRTYGASDVDFEATVELAVQDDPGRGETGVVITYSDGEVARGAPWPQTRLVRAEPFTVPTATRPGPAGVVKW